MAASFVNQTSNTAAGTPLTLTVPSSTVNGDMLLAVIVVNGSTHAPTPPAGWTQIEGDDTGPTYYAYRRTASSEPASYDWTAPSGNAMAGAMATYRGVTVGSLHKNSGANRTVTSTTITATTITPTVDGCMLVFLGVVGTAEASFTGPSGWNQRSTPSRTGASAIIADLVQATAGATGSITATYGTSGNNYGSVIAMTPAVAAINIPTGTSAAVAAATLAATAQTQVPLASSAAVAAATLSASAQTQVPLASAAAASSATLSLIAPTQVPLGTAAAVASDTLAVHAPTQIPLAAAAATASATLALTDETLVPLQASAATSSATLALTTGTVTPPTPTPTGDVVSGWKPWLRTPEGAPFHAEVQPARVYARAFPARFTITYRASVATAGTLIRAVAPTLAVAVTADISRVYCPPLLARNTTDQRIPMLEKLLTDMERDAADANTKAVLLEAELVAGREEIRLLTVEADTAHDRAAELTARVETLTGQLDAERSDLHRRLADEHEVVDALMAHVYHSQPAEMPESSPPSPDLEFARLLEDVLIASEA